MKHITALAAMLCMLTVHGCLRIEQDRPWIRGGMNESFSNVCLTTLDLEPPDDDVVVAVIYPAAVDMNWFDGASGNGDDFTSWKEDYTVRLQDDTKPKKLTVAWEYSAKNRMLTIGGVRFELPKGKIAIITIVDGKPPLFDLRDNSPAVVESLRKELGAIDTMAQPAQPLDDKPAVAQ